MTIDLILSTPAAATLYALLPGQTIISLIELGRAPAAVEPAPLDGHSQGIRAARLETVAGRGPKRATC